MEKFVAVIALVLLFANCTVSKKYSGDYVYFYEFDQPVEGEVLINKTYFRYTHKSPSRHFNIYDRLSLPKQTLYLGKGSNATTLAYGISRHYNR